MADEPRALSIPIPGGRIEALLLAGGPGRPLLVLGGVETGLRPLAGSEHAHVRRWSRRTPRRPVVIMGRPLPDDPADAPRMLHPRASAESVARGLRALRDVVPPLAVEAESGGGRISLWLTVDHPAIVARLVLSSVASETTPDSAMTGRMAQWLALAEQGAWADFFAHLALQLKPAGSVHAEAYKVDSGFQPHPSTPERFIGELRATLDPTSFVTDRLGEIAVPTLVLAGGQDQVVPLASTQLVADRVSGARMEVDPESGHTVRTSFRGYDELVEAFLAEGDQPQP
ncbi:MAG TPA: alpha/beta fold hydrolase [Candidatus Limnocylindria bacterium]|nr:alpha/beta fold hydrolase [Candidatus Limnocylindria bacterium]